MENEDFNKLHVTELGIAIKYDNYSSRVRKKDEETTTLEMETRIYSRIETIKVAAKKISDMFEKSLK